VARFRISDGDTTRTQGGAAADSFTVDQDVLQKALIAHSSWKARLRAAIVNGKLDIAVSSVKVDNQCAFGKWLYGSEVSTLEKQTEQYRSVKQLHAKFHEEAAKVAQFAISGHQQEAENAMAGDFNNVSSALMGTLSKLGRGAMAAI
jgi:hypothetical protein